MEMLVSKEKVICFQDFASYINMNKTEDCNLVQNFATDLSLGLRRVTLVYAPPVGNHPGSALIGAGQGKHLARKDYI